MQNKYVGDIGDYSKFVLIKHIFDGKCGLIWYLYPNENNSDGIHIEYDRYNLKDKEVTKLMKQVSEDKKVHERNIKELEKVLSKDFNITFFNECIEEENCQFFKDYKKRLSHRKEWFDRALDKIHKCDVVFVDPDNGIQIKSCPTKGRKKSGKFIYFDEINSILNQNKTLVIYQHLIRKKTDEFVKELKDRLRESLKNRNLNLTIIKFNRVSPRLYLIITKDNLDKKIQDFCNLFENEFTLIDKSNL